jgi:hypothetical protein
MQMGQSTVLVYAYLRPSGRRMSPLALNLGADSRSEKVRAAAAYITGRDPHT